MVSPINPLPPGCVNAHASPLPQAMDDRWQHGVDTLEPLNPYGSVSSVTEVCDEKATEAVTEGESENALQRVSTFFRGGYKCALRFCAKHAANSRDVRLARVEAYCDTISEEWSGSGRDSVIYRRILNRLEAVERVIVLYEEELAGSLLRKTSRRRFAEQSERVEDLRTWLHDAVTTVTQQHFATFRVDMDPALATWEASAHDTDDYAMLCAVIGRSERDVENMRSASYDAAWTPQASEAMKFEIDKFLAQCLVYRSRAREVAAGRLVERASHAIMELAAEAVDHGRVTPDLARRCASLRSETLAHELMTDASKKVLERALRAFAQTRAALEAQAPGVQS